MDFFKPRKRKLVDNNESTSAAGSSKKKPAHKLDTAGFTLENLT